MDDTLVLHGPGGRELADCRLASGDLLRKGALDLLRRLSRQHEVWIYTTSYRWPRLLKASFWLKGVRIRRVVNEREHRRAMAAFEPDCRPSKHPRHFGIDVHVDDSVGVLEEGRRLGFEVIQVDPDDQDWVHTVTEGIRRSLVRAS